MPTYVSVPSRGLGFSSSMAFVAKRCYANRFTKPRAPFAAKTIVLMMIFFR